MSVSVSPTLTAVWLKVQAFVVSIVPSGTPVIRGPVNRASLPSTPSVIITPLFQSRLRTNQHTDLDPYPLAGSTKTEMGTLVDMQLDVYGPDSGDWAEAIKTLWRDEYGCNMLSPEAAPLYTDDIRMIPLVTGENQFLERRVITAALQWNAVTQTPQDFADAVSVTLVDVDVAYPP